MISPRWYWTLIKRRRNWVHISRVHLGVCARWWSMHRITHSVLSTLSLDAFVQVIDAWAEIYDRLGKESDIVYPLIF